MSLSSPTPLKKEMLDYAKHSLENRGRGDVYYAIINLARNWDNFESDEERRAAYLRIRFESTSSSKTLFSHSNNFLDAYNYERKQPSTTNDGGFVAAYIAEYWKNP